MDQNPNDLKDLLSRADIEGMEIDPRGRLAASKTGVAERSLRILAADDARSIRLLVEMALQRRGHTVVAVCDGIAALEELERQDFDVVLIDGWMPRMSGPMVIRKIREGEAGTTRHVQIVALTGQVSESERAESLESGADAWVAKPFDVTRLHEFVEVSDSAAPSEAVGQPPGPWFDRETFLGQVAGLPDLADELATSVRNEWAGSRGLVTPEAIAIDPIRAALAAHRLKGVVSQFGGTEAAALAATVEAGASSGDIQSARRAAVRLPEVMESLDRSMSRVFVPA